MDIRDMSGKACLNDWEIGLDRCVPDLARYPLGSFSRTRFRSPADMPVGQGILDRAKAERVLDRIHEERKGV